MFALHKRPISSSIYVHNICRKSPHSVVALGLSVSVHASADPPVPCPLKTCSFRYEFSLSTAVCQQLLFPSSDDQYGNPARWTCKYTCNGALVFPLSDFLPRAHHKTPSSDIREMRPSLHNLFLRRISCKDGTFAQRNTSRFEPCPAMWCWGCSSGTSYRKHSISFPGANIGSRLHCHIKVWRQYRI